MAQDASTSAPAVQKEGSFPDDDHSYTVKDEEYEKFAAMVRKRRQV